MQARTGCLTTAILIVTCLAPRRTTAQATYAGDPVDVAREFTRPEQVHFLAARVARFDPATGRGALQWDRYVRQPGLNFNKVDAGFARGNATEFPGTEYDRDPVLPFRIDFVSPRTLRIRLSTRDLDPERMAPDSGDVMLAGPVPVDGRSWRVQQDSAGITWTSAYGRVRLARDPWAIEVYDATGKRLTRTLFAFRYTLLAARRS